MPKLVKITSSNVLVPQGFGGSEIIVELTGVIGHLLPDSHKETIVIDEMFERLGLDANDYNYIFVSPDDCPETMITSCLVNGILVLKTDCEDLANLN